MQFCRIDVNYAMRTLIAVWERIRAAGRRSTDVRFICKGKLKLELYA